MIGVKMCKNMGAYIRRRGCVIWALYGACSGYAGSLRMGAYIRRRGVRYGRCMVCAVGMLGDGVEVCREFDSSDC